MSTEVKKLPTLTVRSLVIAVIFCIVATYLNAYADVLGHNNRMNLRESGGWPASIPAGIGYSVSYFALTLPFAAAMRVLPKKYRLNMAEMAFIIASIMLIPTLTGQSGPAGTRWIVSPSHAYNTAARKADMVSYLSPLLFPKDPNVLDPMRFGGAAVPWDAWMVPMMYQMAFFMLLYLFFFFGTALMQEQYIDVESLAFPATTANYNIIRTLTGQEETKGPKFPKSLLLIGFAIGFLMDAIYTFWGLAGAAALSGMIPANPLVQDFTKYQFIMAPLMVDLDPRLLPLPLLTPMGVAVTVPLVQIVGWMILPSIFISMGQLVSWPSGQSAATLQAQKIGLFLDSPLSDLKLGYMPFIMGVIFGIAIAPIISFRKNLIISLRKAISGEGGAWMSPRLLWAGWCLSGLAFVVVFTMIETPIYFAVVWLALTGLLFMGWGRIANESGGVVFMGTGPGWGDNPPGIMMTDIAMYGVGLTGYKSSAVYNTALVGTNTTGGVNMGIGNSDPMLWNMEAFKLGQLTNADRRQMSVAILVGTLLPILVGFPTQLWLAYTYGWDRASVPNTSRAYGDATGLMANRPTYGNATGGNPIPLTYVIIVIGALVPWLLSVARARWGPMRYISPAGLVIAFWSGYLIWIWCIIAALIRFIVYRVGGAKMYDEKVMPIAIGLIMAAAFNYLFLEIPLRVLKGQEILLWMSV